MQQVEQLNLVLDDLEKNVKLRGSILYELYHKFRENPGKSFNFKVIYEGKSKDATISTYKQLFVMKLVVKLTETMGMNYVRRWTIHELIKQSKISNEVGVAIDYWIVNKDSFFTHIDNYIQQQIPEINILSARIGELLVKYGAQLKVCLQTLFDTMTVNYKKARPTLKQFNLRLLNAGDFISLVKNDKKRKANHNSDEEYSEVSESEEEVSQGSMNSEAPVDDQPEVEKTKIRVRPNVYPLRNRSPRTPEIPKQQKTSESLRQPKTPDRTSTPRTPETPKTPSKPSTPGTPKTPDRSSNPVTPKTPEIVEDLSTSSKSEIPSEPQTPKSPASRDVEYTDVFTYYKNNKNVTGSQCWIFPFTHSKSMISVDYHFPIEISVDTMINLYNWNVLVVVVPPGYTLRIPEGWHQMIPKPEPLLNNLLKNNLNLRYNGFSSSIMFNLLTPDSMFSVILHYLTGCNYTNNDLNVVDMFIKYAKDALKSKNINLPRIKWLLLLILEKEQEAIAKLKAAGCMEQTHFKECGTVCVCCGFYPYKHWFIWAQQVICIFCASGIKCSKIIKLSDHPSMYCESKRVQNISEVLQQFSQITPEMPNLKEEPKFTNSHLVLHNTKIVKELLGLPNEPVLIKNRDTLSMDTQKVDIMVYPYTPMEQNGTTNISLDEHNLETNECCVAKITNNRYKDLLHQSLEPSEKESDLSAYGKSISPVIFHHGYLTKGLCKPPFNGNTVVINL